ncbi:hypothetical protein JTE90_014088 [Oedothorax gibbosus]|uniref:Uncharacterized protein n=1 Tax=Oedothorax gibbosus TaxID=931172 RepID=A0AAV6V6N1_9ARAC|nr:hypothetical protein JTE90_014088 [Oedothorax gibbosus]
MKFLLLILGLILASSCSVLADPQCHTSEVMQCADIAIQWVQTLPKQSIATTEEDVAYACQELTEAIECALKYKDSCMTPLQKEAVGFLLDGVFEFRDSFCKSGNALRATYLAHATCLNKVSQSEGLKEQIEYSLAVLEGMMTTKNSDKIMYSCCGYRKIRGELCRMVQDTCGQEALDMVMDLIHMVSAQLPDVVCNSIDGNEDRCQQILPAPGTKVSSDMKSKPIYEFLQNSFSTWVDL